MLNYNHLYYFHVVASEGSFAAAAERLGVTQPTISEQIRTLERALGGPLFERQATGLKLTQIGRTTYEQTSVMFDAAARLREALGLTSPPKTATLRIGVTTIVAHTTSTDFLLPLFDHEEFVPSIRCAEASELIRDVRKHEIDLAIVETEPPQAARQGLEVTPLSEVALVAVSRPGTKPAPDWHDASIITYRNNTVYRWEVEAFLDQGGLRPRVAGESDDTRLLLEAAARGGHIVFVPGPIAREAIASGRLATIADLPNRPARVYAVYQDEESSALTRNAVRRLVAHATPAPT